MKCEAYRGDYPITRPFGVVDPAYSNYPGSRHPGLDVGLGSGSGLFAVITGRGSTRNSQGKIGRGNELIITSPDGHVQVKYCHMEAFNVQNGQFVRKGDFIGASGYTGYVVDNKGEIGTRGGAHLHIEVLIDGVYQDPQIKLTEDLDMSKMSDGELQKLAQETGAPLEELRNKVSDKDIILAVLVPKIKGLEAELAKVQKTGGASEKQILADTILDHAKQAWVGLKKYLSL